MLLNHQGPRPVIRKRDKVELLCISLNTVFTRCSARGTEMSQP